LVGGQNRSALGLRGIRHEQAVHFSWETILGWAGWWIGAQVGLMTGFVLSSLGSVAGVYLGWRINRDYLS
jgi:hypothetical protein